MTLKGIISSMNNLTVSLDELNKAFGKVRKELAREGLLWKNSPLDEVDCYNSYIDLAGFTGTLGYCYVNGDIYIPYLFPAALVGEKRNIVDVLRHEFGHALTDRYKKHFRGIFREAFGRAYGEKPYKAHVEDWSQNYVSEYAASATQEDWAETFMLYLKHKGNLPRKFAGKPVLERKWNAVAQICAAIANE